MDMALIQGAIGGLKVAADIAISLGKLNTLSEVNAKAIELQQVILLIQGNALSAQSEQFALVEEIRTLKEEIMRLKAWDAEKERYRLSEPWPGSLAYAVKKSMSNSEPAHYICTNCYENGRKSILNPKKDARAFVNYACPTCKAEVSSGARGIASAEYAPDQ